MRGVLSVCVKKGRIGGPISISRKDIIWTLILIKYHSHDTMFDGEGRFSILIGTKKKVIRGLIFSMEIKIGERRFFFRSNGME